MKPKLYQPSIKVQRVPIKTLIVFHHGGNEMLEHTHHKP